MVKIVNQGSYGCIYYPGFGCDGKLRKKDEKYITKVQRKVSISKSEEEVGKLITTIKNYEDYFAPVIESCPVSIATLENDEITKCDFLRDPKARESTYQSNKIKYVGKDSLGDHLLHVLKTGPKKFYRRTMTSYLHLLQGLVYLSEKNIVHYDIKDNNIIVQTKTGNPILIDFGLSIENLPTPKNDSFYTYAPDYEAWCFEIALINYIFQEKVDTSAPLPKNKFLNVLDEFLSKNMAWIDYFTEAERNDYRTQILSKIDIWEKKSAGEVITECIAAWKSWDNYAIAILFLGYFHSFDINTMEFSHTKTLVSEWKTICMALPEKRPSAAETLSDIKTKFKKINRKENHASKMAISDKFKKEGVLQKATDSFHESRRKSNEKEVIRQQAIA